MSSVCGARVKQKRSGKFGTVCHICGLPVDLKPTGNSPLASSLDHIVPRTAGGKGVKENLKLTHAFCNNARRHYEITEQLRVMCRNRITEFQEANMIKGAKA